MTPRPDAADRACSRSRPPDAGDAGPGVARLLHAVTVGVILTAVLGVATGHAAGIRFTGESLARYVELRPLELRTAPASEATLLGGGWAELADGTIAWCPVGADSCRYYAPGDEVSVAPFTQDLAATAWGLTEGLRAHVRVRARGGIDGDRSLWPEADDDFDLLDAYVELTRERYRVRAGRLWITTQLGRYDADGVAGVYRPWPRVEVEAFAGRALIRGTFERIEDGDLTAIEPYLPDAATNVWGGAVRWHDVGRGSVSLQYQREIRADRLLVYSERVGAFGHTRLGPVRVDGTFEADLLLDEVNEARLGLTVPVATVEVGLQYRRHRPFFPLWSIWYAFSPVGYDEALGRIAWRHPGRNLSVRLSLARREYEPTHVGLVFAPLQDDAWRGMLRATWRPGRRWEVDAGYEASIGNGESLSGLDARVGYSFGRRVTVGVTGSAFQFIREYRIASGFVDAVAVDGSVQITPLVRAEGSVSRYWHTGDIDSDDVDWSQTRGVLRVVWTVGTEPRRTPGRVGEAS